MKIEYKNGWYRVKSVHDNVKYEVTIYDGINSFCEDIKCSSLHDAYEYCKVKINATHPQ